LFTELYNIYLYHDHEKELRGPTPSTCVCMTMYSHCMFMYDYPDGGFFRAFSPVLGQMPE